MAILPKLPPSLWVAIGLVGFVFGGGAVSGAVQVRESRAEARKAAAELTGGGDAVRGKATFQRVGCGACHAIKAVDGADGAVGPPLDNVAARAFLAGRLANSPANLIRWVQHPQAIEPGNGMPDPPVSERETRDIVAYLYTLKRPPP